MAGSARKFGRRRDALRPLRIKRRYTRSAPGSVLIQCGETIVLCTASVEAGVPSWLAGRRQGWVTAEYAMLPGSTSPRKRRERGTAMEGRTSEIQRLIGRSLRAATELAALGERTIVVDCDVLQADGGTRTAGITGGFVALVDALHAIRRDLPEPGRSPLRTSVAAVSVGIVAGELLLDLDYAEDAEAEVDMNLVMTGGGEIIEVQGTGEGSTFSRRQLVELVDLAGRGIALLTDAQRRACGKLWPGP